MKKLNKTLLQKFDYKLPKDLIAQVPTKPRDAARLLILDKKTNHIDHKYFFDLGDYLNPGDVLVLNNSKVIPARLLGYKSTGGKIEIFLLNKKFPSLPSLPAGRQGGGQVDVADNFGQPLFNLPLERGENNNIWQVLIKGKVKINQEIIFSQNIKATIIKKHDDQSWLVKFNSSDKKIFSIGHTPLPPYIKKSAKMSDYQTIYAQSFGSVAAPTAGLHFTKKLLKELKKKGVKIEYITLHVGLGTFLPVKTKYIEDHKIHSELAILNPQTAKIINQAKQSGHQIIAVGTTSARTLEAFSNHQKLLKPQSKWVNIFIYPGYKFKIIDGLITNFHLPKSTLLMLVSALAGEKNIKKAYQIAIAQKYKFFSFGDAMLIK